MAGILDDTINAVKDTYYSVKNKVASLPADLAARGKVITNTQPTRPANQDIAAMAEDSARRQGRGSKLASPMTPVSKKEK
jgi:hypothetical protein